MFNNFPQRSLAYYIAFLYRPACQKISTSPEQNNNLRERMKSAKSVHTWKFLLKIFIFDVLSLTAYSPSADQTNSSAEPNDLFLHAKAVYMMYSPSPQTTTNLPLGLCFKVCNISVEEKLSHPCTQMYISR